MMTARLTLIALVLVVGVLCAEDVKSSDASTATRSGRQIVGRRYRPESSKRPAHPFGKDREESKGKDPRDLEITVAVDDYPVKTFRYPTPHRQGGAAQSRRPDRVKASPKQQNYRQHDSSFRPYYPENPPARPPPRFEEEPPYFPEPSIPHFPSPPAYDLPLEPVYPEPPLQPYHPEPAKPLPYQPPYPNAYDAEAYPAPAPACPLVYRLPTTCRPLKDCTVWFDLVSTTKGSTCKLHSGGPGVCCSDIPTNGYGGPLRTITKDVRIHRDIDGYALNFAARAGQFNVRVVEEMERQIRANNMTLRRNSAPFSHVQFFSTKQATVNVSRGAYVVLEATRELGKRFELTPDETGFGLTEFSLRNTILNTTCPADPICDPETASSPFRTFDGSCNNLRRPSWGRAGGQVQRHLPPAYADGVWSPRVAQSGRPLPSPRLVSISIVPDIDSPSPTESLWLMQYGQFVTHDITMTPVFRMANGQGISCCEDNGLPINNTEMLHPACMPIAIPEDDPFYSRFRQRCMSFVRSSVAPRLDCNFGYAEQMDQISHFLDHSNVYGSEVQDARDLRTFIGGALRTTPRRSHGDMDLLPPDNNSTDDCTLPRNLTGIDPPADVRCFKAGDTRVNQLPDLVTVHTVFMRQHNRLVAELAQINPHWDDERLYLEGRRIMTAQMQHITYNEYLPIVLGRDRLQELGMLPLEQGFSDDYDEGLNPTMVNEFNTAAFRFGHSTIQGRRDLVNQRRQTESTILLRNHFSRPQLIYTPGNLDRFLIGLATQPMQEVDNYFTEEVTNHLFEEPGRGFGLDLVSLNIQRGRDHGIQGYNAYRALCGLPRANSFQDFLDVIPPAIVERFELLYESVDDVDLYIAGVSERPVPGAIIGPTFHCIVSDMFLRLKRGDRYFYDLGRRAGSFTEDQLNEIRSTSFARILCDNSNAQTLQPLAFKIPSASNPIVDCNSPAIPRVSLLPWREEPSQIVRPSGRQQQQPRRPIKQRPSKRY